MAKEKSNTYEAMFLLGPVGQAEPERALELCRKVIEAHGGKIMVIKKWDERKLHYEIRQGGLTHKRGTYIIAFFTAPTQNVAAMDRDVRLSEEIIRALFLRADHLSQEEMQAVEPQPIVQREERPSWDQPYGDRGPRRDDRRDDRGPRPPRREEGAPAPAGAGAGEPPAKD